MVVDAVLLSVLVVLHVFGVVRVHMERSQHDVCTTPCLSFLISRVHMLLCVGYRLTNTLWMAQRVRKKV